MTAVCACVSTLACLLGLTTYCKFVGEEPGYEAIQIFHEDQYCEACEGQWRAAVRVYRLGLRAKTTEVEACVALVCASTDEGDVVL